jgi:hypothetical protein
MRSVLSLFFALFFLCAFALFFGLALESAKARKSASAHRCQEVEEIDKGRTRATDCHKG